MIDCITSMTVYEIHEIHYLRYETTKPTFCSYLCLDSIHLDYYCKQISPFRNLYSTHVRTLDIGLSIPNRGSSVPHVDADHPLLPTYSHNENVLDVIIAKQGCTHTYLGTYSCIR